MASRTWPARPGSRWPGCRRPRPPEAGVTDGAKVTVATAAGSITVPAEIADLPDRVVWLPANSAGCAVRRDLGAGHGSLVTVRSAE